MLTRPAATVATEDHRCADDAVLVQVGPDPAGGAPGVGLGLRECQVCRLLEVVRVELDRLAALPG